MTRSLPLLFACSGCSYAGRLAYDVAQGLDRRGIAEMSCLAGVGASKSYFLKQLCDREVWIIDGCPLECSRGVFDQAGQHIDVHIRLQELGVRKNLQKSQSFDVAHLIESVMQHASTRVKSARGHA